MTTPLLRSLRQELPHTRIIVAGKAPYAALLEGLSSFDSFLALDDRTSHAQVLRAAHADTALLLPNSWSSAIAAWRAGIPQRIGRRHQGRSVLLQKTLPPIPGAAPMTELYADFLPALGLAREVLPAELVVTAAPVTPLPEGAAFLGVAPGAAFGPSKSYPLPLLQQTLEQLFATFGVIPVWFGAPQERELLEKLAAGLSFASVLPQNHSLSEAKALLQRCQCVLAMDNGARHMAAALHVPQIVLYGPTHPAWSAHALESTTILRREELDCLNCHLKICPKADHPCMNRILPADVVRAVVKAL